MCTSVSNMSNLDNMAASSTKRALRTKIQNILKNISSEEKKTQSVKVFEKVNVKNIKKIIIFT